MESVSTKKFLQLHIGVSILLSMLAIIQTVQRVNDLEIVFWRSKWVFLLAIFALNILIGIWTLISSFADRIVEWMSSIENYPVSPFRISLGIVFIVLGFASIWVVRLFAFGSTLPQLMPIFWFFLWASLFQVLGLKLIHSGVKWHAAFAALLLVQGLVYQVYGRFTIVSSDPFSIGYSEAGRHYYASLFFAKALYGISLPYPFLHPSRYLMLSLPFLFDGLPLWAHRLWQVILWIGLTSVSAALLARRMKLNKWMTALIAAWAFLYFLQGAVYYHLHVAVILVLAGVSAQRPWRSLLFIILASVWAGISRVNWFPVPAMLAIAIYVLEIPIAGKGWRYWLTPFIWGASGLGTALVSQFVYIGISGNADTRAFGSSFTSDLLWNRLLPNPTYPLGILLGILIVTSPLLLALYQMLRGRTSQLHPLRWLVLAALTGILFAGGALVSTKIGGGGDLHNMDAYLVLLGLVTMSFWAGQVSVEGEAKPVWGQVRWNAVFAAVLIPLAFALPGIRFMHKYDPSMTDQDIQRLQHIVSETVANGGEVLFVTERQLFTFGELQGIPLVPEYEQVELMEMAMSGNREYLQHYYADLKSGRFALIIAEEQKFNLQKIGSFVEEDNAWVRYAGAPLLCAYKPFTTLTSVNVQIFEPRPDSSDCKNPFSE